MKAFFQRYTWGIIPLLLCLIGMSGYYVVLFRGKAASQAQEKERLVAQLREANEAQKSAIITRRVSSQLEEIAYQQKDISDAQKQEAENQKLIAEQMRDHAELEREKAIVAQQAALEAYEQMDAQKRIAEQRRAEAEVAQMRADSLARLALARSLAVQATKQYEVGNKPLAALLSYSAWKFTAENQGDLYLPALYKALSLSSELSHQWRVHRGAIRSLLSYSLGGNAYLLTTSQYGEIYRWKLSAGQLMDRQTLFNDPKYDIRSMRVDTLHRRLFAMAYGGQLLIISAANKVEIHELPISQPVGMEYWQEQVVIAQKNGVLCVVSPDTGETKSFYQHPCAITALTLHAGQLLVGDAEGGIYQVDSQGKARFVWKELAQPITVLCTQASSGKLAIGYKNGAVWVVEADRKKANPFSEHVSAVTCIMFHGSHLYTSSLDGSICLWQLQDEQHTNASLVYEGQAWLHTFSISQDERTLIVGDEKGNVSRVVVDPQRMADQIYQSLERNFTPEEWNLYIGEVSAYETYVSK